MVLAQWPAVARAGFLFLLRTAPRDRQPPTANRQPPNPIGCIGGCPSDLAPSAEFEDVNAYIRAHSVLESMDLVGIPRVMGVSDMMAGNSLKNLVFVSFLFNHFSVMNWYPPRPQRECDNNDPTSALDLAPMARPMPEASRVSLVPPPPLLSAAASVATVVITRRQIVVLPASPPKTAQRAPTWGVLGG